MSNKNHVRIQFFQFRETESGFTLIESVIAIFILTIALVGTAAAITYALQYSAISRNVTKAKLLVVASFEEVETLRNSRRLAYKQLANAGSVDNADVAVPFSGFTTNFQPIPLNPGTDGVFGTADDIADASPAMNLFSRRVTITDVGSTIKRIEVSVRYPGKGDIIGEITGVSYLNDEARTTQ